MNETVRRADDIAARIFRIIGRILKYSFYAIIVGINAILLWRIFTMGDPAIMETLMVNDRTAAAYAEAGEGLEVTYQKQYHLDVDGRFAQTNLRYLPAIDQLQVTTRYNNSTLEAAAEEFALTAVPDREEDVFDVTLVKVIHASDDDRAAADRDALAADITNPDSEPPTSLPAAETRYHATDVLPHKKPLYNYRRLIFEDVDLSDADACYLEFYYKGALNYDEDPWVRILVWLRGDDRLYELTKDDLRALEGGAVDYD